MSLIEFFNDPKSAVIFYAGIGISILFLIAITNFKNKLMIFTQWFWGYLTSQRHSRIIR